jgi:four helix bundle protein
MAPIRSYRDLDAWTVSMNLAEDCYRFTEGFPKAEAFGLAAHIRRSAVSIPSNIAEGHNRRSRPAYTNHVTIAMGSQAELETQLELARRLKYGDPEEVTRLLEEASEVGRILHGLWTALGNRSGVGPSVESPAPKGKS